MTAKRTVADWKHHCRRASLLAILAAMWVGLVLAAGPSPALAGQPLVWFNPAPESPDYLDLFKKPSSWASARSRVSVFELGPRQLERSGGINSLNQLISVDGFRKIAAWRMRTAISVGAIKEWDCEGRRTSQITLRYVRHVHQNGGVVQLIAMDEPLFSGLGLNKPICNFTVDQAAARTAAFVNGVTAAVQAQGLGPKPDFVDTEPYPSVRVDQHEAWIRALLADGFHPAGYHLDIAIVQVEQRPDLKRRFVGDMRELQAFLRAKHIPLGIVLWSSHDPVRSDRDYFEDTMAWAHLVRNIFGTPDSVIFSSWVARCDGPARCKRPDQVCPGVDRYYCGKTSVPVNLPDNDPRVFSHTRLMLSALDLFK